MMKIPTILHNLFPSRNNSSSSIILDGPTDNDVLCGRDRNFCKHPGNLLYRVQVERQASFYAVATTKQTKMKITKAIVHTMQTQYGSRFLRRTETNQWEVLTNVQARDKTSHALRFINSGNSSYGSQRTSDEDSSEQIESKNSTSSHTTDVFYDNNNNNATQQPAPYRVQCSNDGGSGDKSVVVPSLTKSCTTNTIATHHAHHTNHHHTVVDESTITAIHQRQQELLRASLQNDRMMDVTQNHHHHNATAINDDCQSTLAFEQLFNSPMFTMSSFGATGMTNVNGNSSNMNQFGISNTTLSMNDMRSVGSMSMNQIRSVGGSDNNMIQQYSFDESFNNMNNYHHHVLNPPATTTSATNPTMHNNAFTGPLGSFSIPTPNPITFNTSSSSSLQPSVTDIDEQQRFDSIRTMDMVDLILNRPINDTLRSEELNFLLNDSVMDEL